LIAVSEARVSTIIPLYDHENYVAEAIRSVLAQGALLKELVIVDDGSQDQSFQVAEEFSKSDPRVRLVGQQNRGAHATINRGLSLATGEFVAILNSDDAFCEGRFAALTRALDLDAGSDIASSSIAFMDGSGMEISNPWFDDALNGFKRKRDVASSLIEANYLMTTSNFLVRRSVFAKLGAFTPLRYAHDLEFALRCAASGLRFCFIDRTLLRYRFHSRNTIMENHRKVRVEWALCIASYIRQKYKGDIGIQDARMSDIRATLDRHGLRRASDCALDYMNRRQIYALDDELTGDSGLMQQMTALV
jgi:glycosyltransferase involved in cell wall biosynthesis